MLSTTYTQQLLSQREFQRHAYKQMKANSCYKSVFLTIGLQNHLCNYYYCYYYIRLTAFFQDILGKPVPERQNPSGFCWRKRRWAGSGISWTICKSFALRDRWITTRAPHHSNFNGQMLFLTPNQHDWCTSKDQMYKPALGSPDGCGCS